MLALCGLYIAQGIPTYLFAAALPAILREQGVSRSAIGLIAVLMLPSLIKFLWAPVLDRFPLGRRIGLARLGHRRSWIVPTQIGIVAALVGFAFFPPTTLVPVVVFGLIVAILSATQDIAIDGFATDKLRARDRARGNAIQGGSVAFGVVIGSSLTLYLYANFGWTIAILTIAALSALAMASFTLMDEEALAPTSQPVERKPLPSIRAAFGHPVTGPVLLFALLYRTPEGLVKAMEKPFLIDSGLGLETVGYLSGAAAATAGLVGAAISAWCIRRFGLWNVILGLGLIRGTVFAGFMLCAALMPAPPALLMGLAALDTLSRYMELVALYSLFMGAAMPDRAATDFTLLACIQLFVYTAGGLLSGVLADKLGYEGLYGLATVLSFASLWLALRQVPRNHPALTAQT